MPYQQSATSVGPMASADAEQVIAGTFMDLAQTDNGSWGFEIKETSGVNPVNVGTQYSADGTTWLPAKQSNFFATIAAGTTAHWTNLDATNGAQIMRYIQLSFWNQVAGMDAGVQVLGGFAK